jgi:P-type conjugative transfer protein TrbJ
MRRLVRTAAFVSVILGGARSGRAQWAVVDASNLVQTTSTAISAMHTLKTLVEQVAMAKQTLQSLTPTSFSGLRALLDQGQLELQSMRGDLSALGFALADVDRGFDRLFPRDPSTWSRARYSDYDRYYTGWTAQITASAKLAERAQSTALLVEGNNRQVANILGQSSTAAGEVRQLQLVNQQLALIHARLGDLVQNIATLARVSSNLAATSAGEKLLLREAKLRRREGYTSRGPAARVLDRLP